MPPRVTPWWRGVSYFKYNGTLENENTAHIQGDAILTYYSYDKISKIIQNTVDCDGNKITILLGD